MSRVVGFLLLGLATPVLCLPSPAWAADVKDLVEKLKDKDTDVRRAAAVELMKSGTEAKEAAPALVAALKDPDAFVRRYSAQALGAIGADPQVAIPALTGVLKNANEKKEAQAAAVASLTENRRRRRTALAGVVRDPNLDSSVRLKIIDALAHFGTDSKPALGTVMDEFMGKNVPKGRAVLQNEEKREEKLALLAVLEKIVTPDDKAVIGSLAEVLVNKGIPTGRGTLDQREKALVLTILGNRLKPDDKAVIATLSDALAARNYPKGTNPPSPQEHRLVLGLLTKIATYDDKPYVSALEAVEKDEKLKDAQLKKAVSEALKKVMEKK